MATIKLKKSEYNRLLRQKAGLQQEQMDKRVAISSFEALQKSCRLSSIHAEIQELQRTIERRSAAVRQQQVRLEAQEVLALELQTKLKRHQARITTLNSYMTAQGLEIALKQLGSQFTHLPEELWDMVQYLLPSNSKQVCLCQDELQIYAMGTAREVLQEFVQDMFEVQDAEQIDRCRAFDEQCALHENVGKEYSTQEKGLNRLQTRCSGILKEISDSSALLRCLEMEQEDLRSQYIRIQDYDPAKLEQLQKERSALAQAIQTLNVTTREVVVIRNLKKQIEVLESERIQSLCDLYDLKEAENDSVKSLTKLETQNKTDTETYDLYKSRLIDLTSAMNKSHISLEELNSELEQIKKQGRRLALVNTRENDKIRQEILALSKCLEETRHAPVATPPERLSVTDSMKIRVDQILDENCSLDVSVAQTTEVASQEETLNAQCHELEEQVRSLQESLGQTLKFIKEVKSSQL